MFRGLSETHEKHEKKPTAGCKDKKFSRKRWSTEHTEYTEMVNGRPVLIDAIRVKLFCLPFFCHLHPRVSAISAVPSFHLCNSSDSWLLRLVAGAAAAGSLHCNQ